MSEEQGCRCCLSKEYHIVLVPCACSLCWRCMVSFLAETRLSATLTCRLCGRICLQHQILEKTSDGATRALTHGYDGTQSQIAAATPVEAQQTASRAEKAEVSPVAPTTPRVGKKRKATKSPQTSPKRTKKNKKQSSSSRTPLGRPTRKRKTFDEHLEELKAFKQLHGHCLVPTRKSTQDSDLGEWVKNIRRGRVKASVEQRKRLNEVGFIWETRANRFDREWHAMLEKLKAYKKQTGDCRVPWKYAPDQPLAEWVHTHRKLNNQNALRADRKKLLEEVGFVWRAKDKGQTDHQYHVSQVYGTQQDLASLNDSVEQQDSDNVDFPSNFM